MVVGVIGPIDLDHTELYENNTVSISGEESFTIICTNTQAKQIMGLCGEVNNETYNKTTLLSSKSDWGVIWVDSSQGLSSNDDITHRGWYLPINAEPETDLGADYVHLTFTGWKLSSYEHDYLCMDYTPGVNDGTVIDHGYSDVATTYALQDTFTTYASPTTWAATVKSGMTTGSFSASPAGYLCATGQSNSDGTWNGMYTYTVDELPYPSTLEFDLRWSTTPAGYSAYWVGYLLPTAPMAYADLTTTSLRILVEITKSGVYYYLSKYSGGTKTHLKTKIALGTSKNPKFKVNVESGNIAIYIDKAGGTNYSKIYSSSLSSAGLSWLNGGFYFAYQLQNMDNTSITAYSSFCNDYYDTNNTYNNIVALPCTTPITTRDFSRYSSDGLIPCYRNPSSDLYFWQDYENYYNGSVKAYNSNYADATPRIVTGTDEVLDPAKFYVSNGLIKLTTGSGAATPITFSAYTSPGGWAELQGLSVGEINLLKPLYISPERQTYQINDTKWTLQRGKQHVLVEHPYTAISYRTMGTYYHDTTTTTTPGANADITMTSQYYTNINNTDNLVDADTATAGSVTNSTTPFEAVNSTVTPAIDWVYGTNDRSLKVTTSNAGAGEGHRLVSTYRPTVTPGKVYTSNQIIYGASGTVRPYLTFRNSGGTSITDNYGAIITLDGTVKSATMTAVCPVGASRVDTFFRTPTQQSMSYNVGQVIIVEGSSIPDGSMNPLTGDIYNYVKNELSANIATGTDSGGNTTGFAAASTSTPATISSSTTYAKNGTNSLKTVAGGYTTGEGFSVSGFVPTPGATYSAKAWVYAPAGTSLYLYFRQSGIAHSNAHFTTSGGGFDAVQSTLTATSPTTPTMYLGVYTSPAQAATFYTDEISITMGSTPPTGKMDMTTGVIVTQPNFQIVQTEPTTIKSDSIPAAAITGLGYYEATPQSTYNSYTSIAGEFMKQTEQKVNIRKV